MHVEIILPSQQNVNAYNINTWILYFLNTCKISAKKHPQIPTQVSKSEQDWPIYLDIRLFCAIAQNCVLNIPWLTLHPALHDCCILLQCPQRI